MTKSNCACDIPLLMAYHTPRTACRCPHDNPTTRCRRETAARQPRHVTPPRLALMNARSHRMHPNTAPNALLDALKTVRSAGKSAHLVLPAVGPPVSPYCANVCPASLESPISGFAEAATSTQPAAPQRRALCWLPSPRSTGTGDSVL